MALTYNGDAGETWTNDTGKVQYQLIVSWQNSCGQCIALDHAIGDLWPIPFHPGCRCQQKTIFPGSGSLPFVDFRAKIADLSDVQQVRVVGRANLALIDSGVVAWGDVVTPSRIRALNEVVALKKLTVAQMVRAGVRRGIAKQAKATARQAAAAAVRAKLQAADETFATRQAAAAAVRAKLQAADETFATQQAAAAAARAKLQAADESFIAARQAYLESARVKKEIAARIAREEAKAATEAAAKAATEAAAKAKAEAAAAAKAKAEAAAAMVAGPYTPARTLTEAEAWGKARGITAINAVSLDDWNAINAEVAKLPPKVIATIARAGLRMDILTGGGITDHPEYARFRGVTPRGWTNGMTWDDVPGSGGISGTVIAANRVREGHGSQNLVIHEHGHTYDAALAKLTGTKGSDSAQWRAIHAAVPWESAYLEIREEGYVESLARYLQSERTRALLPEPVRAYWDAHFR